MGMALLYVRISKLCAVDGSGIIDNPALDRIRRPLYREHLPWRAHAGLMASTTGGIIQVTTGISVIYGRFGYTKGL